MALSKRDVALYWPLRRLNGPCQPGSPDCGALYCTRW